MLNEIRLNLSEQELKRDVNINTNLGIRESRYKTCNLVRYNRGSLNTEQESEMEKTARKADVNQESKLRIIKKRHQRPRRLKIKNIL